jgi:hypothetical protein
MSPILKGQTVVLPCRSRAENVNFDAVAAHLQVNEAGKAPLLCVTGTYKVASGNLTLPGIVTREKK